MEHDGKNWWFCNFEFWLLDQLEHHWTDQFSQNLEQLTKLLFSEQISTNISKFWKNKVCLVWSNTIELELNFVQNVPK